MDKYDCIVSVFVFGLLAVCLFLILMGLSGCHAHAMSDTLDKISSSAWESTMNAVAKTNWFGTFCLLGFFGGIVAIGLDQRKIGGAIVIASIATICLGLAIHRFPTWLAIIGFTSSIIAVGYSILIKNKALVEIIRGVQNFRDKSPHRKVGTWTPELDECLNEAQKSESTKKIVAKIKAKNGNQNTG